MQLLAPKLRNLVGCEAAAEKSGAFRMTTRSLVASATRQRDALARRVAANRRPEAT